MAVNNGFERIIAATTSYAYSNPVRVAGYPAVNFEVENASGQTMNSFKVQARDITTDADLPGNIQTDGEWYDLIVDGDFDEDPIGNLLFYSADPGALANAAKAHVQARVLARDIRFAAKLAAGSGNVKVRGMSQSLG